jgi:hypothetical protein
MSNPAPPPLTDFEGKAVRRSVIKVTNAGDGLSESLKLDPVEYHQGERGVLIIEGVFTRVGFSPIDRDEPEGDQERVHTFKATAGKMIDRGVVAEIMDEHARRLEEAKGLQKLPGDVGAAGGGSGEDRCPYPGCPLPPEHDGDHEVDPESGLAGTAEAVLVTCSREQLRELATRHGVEFTDKTRAPTIVKGLVRIAGITEEAEALLAAASSPDNITALGTKADRAKGAS